MKYAIRSLLCVLCLMGSTLAAASDTPTKIGVLDWQQLLAKAPQAEAAGKRLENEFEKPKKNLMDKQKEFQAKRDKITRDKDVMSVADRSKKEKELAKMEQDIRRMDEELRSDYTTRHREEMDAFILTVKSEVEKLAQDDKYQLVIPQEATLYVADSIDITEKVLEKLDKSSKTTKTSDNKKVDSKDKKTES